MISCHVTFILKAPGISPARNLRRSRNYYHLADGLFSRGQKSTQLPAFEKQKRCSFCHSEMNVVGNTHADARYISFSLFDRRMFTEGFITQEIPELILVRKDQ